MGRQFQRNIHVRGKKNIGIVIDDNEIEILKRNVRDLQEQYQSALRHNKRLIEQNAEAMVIIGHKQQEIDAMIEIKRAYIKYIKSIGGS